MAIPKRSERKQRERGVSRPARGVPKALLASVASVLLLAAALYAEVFWQSTDSPYQGYAFAGLVVAGIAAGFAALVVTGVRFLARWAAARRGRPVGLEPLAPREAAAARVPGRTGNRLVWATVFLVVAGICGYGGFTWYLRQQAGEIYVLGAVASVPVVFLVIILARALWGRVTVGGGPATLGMDIGTDSIKVVAIRGRRGRRRLADFAIVDTPPGAVRGGMILEQAVVAELVADAVGGMRGRTKQVLAAVGGQGVMLRCLDLPRMPERELREAARWEAANILPVPVDQCVLGFAVLKGRSPERAEVVVTAIQKGSVEMFAGSLGQAGLGLAGLEPEAVALARLAAELWDLRSPQAVAVLDLGKSSTRLTVVCGGSAKFTRVMPVGGAVLTEAVAEGGGVDGEQAEELKRKHGVAPDTPISGALQKFQEELLGETAKSLEFYFSRHRDEQLLQVVLLGGGAKMRGLREAVAQEIGVTTQVIDLAPLFAYDEEILTDLEEFGHLLAVAVGAALGHG